MARIINSPGVQITEKDLSLRTQIQAGTTIVVPGFAPQGPVSEPLLITSTSELEAIYGIPSTPAEMYFYYSCKEVLNSPGVLNTVRLPYGSGTGSAYSASYGALFYPMLSTTGGDWEIGAPVSKNLSQQQYTKLVEGNFDWINPTLSVTSISSVVETLSTVTYTAATSANGLAFALQNDIDGQNITISTLSGVGGLSATFTFNLSSYATQTVASSATLVEDLTGNNTTVAAGFFILNDLQTVVNEYAEGYYVGFADNSAYSVSSPDFESITALTTLTGSNEFGPITTERVDFALSATLIDSNKGLYSISESLEKVGFIGFETDEYQDHLSLGVFKIRRSTSDASKLSLATTERYLGSFDYNRRQVSPTGGILSNAFIEDSINAASPTIKMFINPKISKQHDWTINSTLPTSRVTVANSAKALFPIGVFTPDSRSQESTKIIGSVPGKLDKALRPLESIENSVVDVIVDAGLSTIFAMTNTLGLSSFNDETFVSEVSALTDDFRAVSDTFVNFAQNTRKDCMAIIDPLRPVFVMGRDSKIIDAEGRTFTQDIYNPLREIASSESNYAAMYANWVKISDIFTGRRIWVPFSGYAAAVFARNDAVSQPWFAPAGLNRGMFNCLDIAFNPNQKQRDRLYEISVNPVVFFSGDGFVVMGQKTLQNKPTAFDRINVRRLFLTLERATQRTLKYFVFEPNTEFTRTRLKSVIQPIFEFAKNTEGLYDYEIVADERNNNSDTIDNNELIVDIYLKSVRSAEFVLVNFIATRTSQNFQEII